MTIALDRIALIGFGEVGQILATDLLKTRSIKISVYDIAFDRADSAQRRAAEDIGVRMAASAAEAVRGAQLVISAVTAGAALDAARSVAGPIDPGAFVMDVNSVAPDTKRAVAAVIEESNGRFIEAAVMAPISPLRLRTPILLGGQHAEELRPALQAMGFATTFHSSEIGRASAVKMCRSIIIKGLEALMMESMLAARHYGVTDDVLTSLTETFPGRDTQKYAAYLMSRALLHGRRRSEEMLEVAATVEDSKLAATMSRPTAALQAWAAEQGRNLPSELLKNPQLSALLDALPDNAELESASREAVQ